jgi:hypothetical protein
MMLGAFFTPSYRDWWLDYVQRPEDMSPYHNHWLVRKSAAHAFAHGLIKLQRLQPSMIEVSFQLMHNRGTSISFHLSLLTPLIV